MASKLTKRNIQAFDGEKYTVWKFRVKSLLAELNVREVVDNDIPDIITDKWRKKDSMAKSIIIEYLSDSFLSFAKDSIFAKDIFQRLDAIYERRSLATQLALRKQLLSLKLQGEVTLLQHFTNFDAIIADLIAAGASLDEMDKISHLLLTLPSVYDGIATALETLGNDNLTLAFVKTRLLDHEVKLRTEDRSNTTLKVLHAGETLSTVKSSRGKTTQKGWKSRKHFKKQKWQPNFFSQKKYGHKSQFKLSKVVCEQCGRNNHKIKDCYYYKRMHQQDNQAQNLKTVQSNIAEADGFAFMMENIHSIQRTNINEIIFLLDSGATDHIVNREDFFSSSSVLSPSMRISVAKTGQSITAIKRGTIQVVTNLGIPGTLEDVLYAPDAAFNLLSVRRIQEKGMRIIFDTEGVTVENGKKEIILKGKPLKGLYGVVFTLNRNLVNRSHINMTKINNFKLWHERLGHISNTKFNKIKHQKLFEDVLDLDDIKPTNEICEACIYGKQARLPFNKFKNKTHVKRPLFIIHTDVCGPITPPTVNNKNYFVIFIDEFTHYTATYLLTYKSEVLNIFRDFVAKSETFFNLKIVNLYCDNGGEYVNNDFKEFCSKKGIMFHFTVPYTPQQNGVAERMNRTITEKARAMINAADLDKQFWGEAVLTATYLINLTPTKAVASSKTPFELWHNKKPRLSHLRVFGSTIYVHLKTRSNKFDDKSVKGILVGYEPNGYKIWNIETEKFLTARDVIVDETNFKTSRPRLSKEVGPPKRVPITNNQTCDVNTENIQIPESSKSLLPEVISQDSNKEQPELRRSDRLKNRPQLFYKENQNDEFDSYAANTQAVIYSVPKSFQEIKERDDQTQWELAIKDELNSLLINDTWKIVSKPLNKNIVTCKWVFILKNDESGNPTKYKARLVARGFSQKYSVDYDEIFAPVARISTFRFLLAFANQFDLLIHQMDVKSAFLNGILHEEIYMQIPEGVEAGNNQVCKLNKSIYGLKQSSRCWYERFDSIMKEKGFKNSLADNCLYYLDKGVINKNIYLLLYVDDIIIVTYEQDSMFRFKQYLHSCFRMTDLNEIKIFLGISVERNEETISINQITYLKNVLQKFGMSDCKSIDTPLPLKVEYDALSSDEFFDAPCKNLIGCLMYAMLSTRPDLCFSINFLSRYQSKNTKGLWKYLKRVLRYVKGTLELKLTYAKSEYKNMLIGYVDADWGNDELDRKSTTGYLFRVFDKCTITWNTRRQNSIATSSTEAEYIALFEGVKEAMWLKSLLSSINLNTTEAIVICEDNTGCISIANNPTHHKRSKHIDIKYHFTRDLIQKGYISLKYLSTGNQLADIFTKSVTASKLMEIRFAIGLH